MNFARRLPNNTNAKCVMKLEILLVVLKLIIDNLSFPIQFIFLKSEKK